MSRHERVKFLSLKASLESVIDLLEALRNAIQAAHGKPPSAPWLESIRLPHT